MRAWLRRLIEPAKTSPADEFQWNDRRPKGQQVANAFRIAGRIFAGFAVVMAAMLGLGGVSGLVPDQSVTSILVSWVAFVASALILVATAHRWAPLVVGFSFGPAIPQILGTLILGDESYYSAHSITRTELIEFLAYALVVVALMSRFIGKRSAVTTVFDRIALTFFVFASLRQLLVPYSFPPWCLLSGVAGLFIAWCASRRLGLESPRGQRRQNRS